MASAGMLKRVSDRTGRLSWEVWWRLDDGSRGSKTVRSKAEARNLLTAKRLAIMRGTLEGHQRGKLPFSHWADEWWALWSSEPERSPATLETTESQLRNHVRPFFERYQVRAVNPTAVRKWQNQLRGRLGRAGVMACRSILFRILQFAEDDGAIALNPMRKVSAPKRPVDPEVVFGSAKRRAPTPAEAGRLLAGFPDFWWDHVITLLGTGLRFGEFAGLRRRRVDLARGIIQVAEVRYQAGKFGSGFKPRPKSEAGIREIPLAPRVIEAIRWQLPPGTAPDDLVFAGPRGRSGPPGRGERQARNPHGPITRQLPPPVPAGGGPNGGVGGVPWADGLARAPSAAGRKRPEHRRADRPSCCWPPRTAARHGRRRAHAAGAGGPCDHGRQRRGTLGGGGQESWAIGPPGAERSA